ncbi:hypothetical protein J6590_069129 [Homalodisca vitripennis]|nr:hypothetical protein J6590_069129 [Homalodisca vitripennis]
MSQSTSLPFNNIIFSIYINCAFEPTTVTRPRSRDIITKDNDPSPPPTPSPTEVNHSSPPSPTEVNDPSPPPPTEVNDLQGHPMTFTLDFKVTLRP